MTDSTAQATLIPEGITTAFSVPGTSRPLVYFIRGGWAVEHDAAAVAPPLRGLPLAELWPGLPTAYRGGFDAACATDTPRVYFFKGATCLLYDTERNEPVGGSTPVPIADRLPGLSKDAPEFTQGVDAGVPAPDGTVYLFRGDQCVVYDTEYDEVLQRGAIADVWRSADHPESEVYGGVAAAFSHPATSNGYLLPRGGTRYVEVNTDRHQVTSGTKTLRGRWPYRSFLGAVDSTEGLLRVFDGDTGQKIRQTSVGTSGGVAFSADGFLAFVSSYREGRLIVCDITAGSLKTVDTSRDAYGVAPLPDGSAVYTGDLSGPGVRAVDLATGTAVTIQAGSQPADLVASPDGRHVYVSCRGDDEIAVIDTATQTVTRRLDAGSRPTNVVVTSDGGSLGILNPSSGSSFVAITTTTGIGSPRLVPVGRDVMGLAVSPDSRTLYAADLGPEVRVIDIGSASQTGTITAAGRPSTLAVTPDGEHLFVTGYRATVIEKFALASGALVDEFPLEAELTEYASLGIGPAWG